MVEIGQTLREARMRARIDITEVEAKTKIRAKYLRAIENEDFDLLPGPVYVRSFLRTYADYLGLDSRMLVDEYRRRFERPSDHDLHPLTPLGRERPRERRNAAGRRRLWHPWATIALVLVVIVAALAVIGEMNGGSKQPSAPVRSSRVSQAPVRAHRHQVRRLARGAPAVAHHPQRVTLTLIPTGRVYVCLVNGRGRQLIPGVIYVPGQTVPTERAGKLLLTLGNANVIMHVDGRPVTVSPTPTAIGFQITPRAVTSLPPPAQPRCT
jgi:cytoskeleton protein RodZ